jgi:colanic acid biosynthesis glycosyl transferase WcaI
LASATIYSKIKKAPIISNVDDLIIEDAYDLEMVTRGSLPSKIAECAARFLYAQVKFVTPISTGYISTIVKYGVNPSRIELVRGGVDLDVFKQIPKTSNGKFRVVYSGGFSVAYDFEQVLQTAKTIANIDSDVEFIFQGKGELSNKIIRRIIELKLKNTKIIDKQLSRVEVSEFLNQADVLLLPLAAFKTPYRGMSSKLYEYQAVGKPIICCSNGLPSEFVRETKSGIVVNSGDSAALVNAVLELKNNPESCQIYGRNGRMWVEKEASILAIGLKMKKIFISCIKGNTC